jgi:hypothetical protein
VYGTPPVEKMLRHSGGSGGSVQDASGGAKWKLYKFCGAKKLAMKPYTSYIKKQREYKSSTGQPVPCDDAMCARGLLGTAEPCVGDDDHHGDTCFASYIQTSLRSGWPR